jgi:hypothetical protein
MYPSKTLIASNNNPLEDEIKEYNNDSDANADEMDDLDGAFLNGPVEMTQQMQKLPDSVRYNNNWYY